MTWKCTAGSPQSTRYRGDPAVGDPRGRVWRRARDRGPGCREIGRASCEFAGYRLLPETDDRDDLLLENVNQAIMCNPRNAVPAGQCGNQYDGPDAPHLHGNAAPGCTATSHISGAGLLNPITNDPKFRLIGSGVPIFLCGAQGMVIGKERSTRRAGGLGP